MKKIKLIFVFLTVLAMVFVSSCSKPNKTESIEYMLSELASYYAEASGSELSLSTPQFIIVLPNGCGADVFEAAAFLSQTLSKYVGYTVKCKYDTDLARSDDNFEIIIGRTSREESREYLKSLRSNDYGYTVFENALTVGAHNSDNLCKAIKMLSTDIESKEISLQSITNTKSKSVCEEYSIESITLNGFRLSEYSIVYSKSCELGESVLAKRFADIIEAHFGYTLEVTDDASVPASARKLCIGETSFSFASDSYNVTSANIIGRDAIIEFRAGDNYGIQIALLEFLDMLRANVSENICSLTLSETKAFAYDSSAVSLMMLDSNKESFTLDEYTLISDYYKNNAICTSALVGLDEASISNISNHIGDTFESIEDVIHTYFDSDKFVCDSFTVHTPSSSGVIFSQSLIRLSDRMEFTYIFAFADSPASEIALSETLGEFCLENSDKTVIAINNFSFEGDSNFAGIAHGSSKISNSLRYNVYISSEKLLITEAVTVEIGSGLSADVITFKFSLL